MYKFNKVCELIHKTGIEADYVSPNFVADTASRNNIKLTSDEVVSISNGYDQWLADNWPEEVSESVNEEVQILDKVIYDKARGYVTGQIDGKMIVMIQGSTYYVDPKDLKEFAKKPDLTTVPHMKFDEKTQALLFEQYVRCGIYYGNVPIKMIDCYVRYNQWEKAAPDQQIKVLIEGNTTFMPKSQVRILEDLNSFANPDNYVPGVLVDEATGEAIENILVDAIDYTSAIGDADAVKIIKVILNGEQEMQTVPKSMVRTLAV